MDIAVTPIERAKADELKLRREIGKLDMQLAIARQQHQKVLAYIELTEVYEGDGGSISEGSRARGGVSTNAVRISTDVIKDRGSPIHTRDLIEILAQQDVIIGGSNPVANLSGFLSRSDELKNDRGRGWGLAEWGEPDQWPQSTGAKLPRPPHLTPEAKRAIKLLEAAKRQDEEAERELAEATQALAGTEREIQTSETAKVGSSPLWEPNRGGDIDDDIPF